MINQQKSFPFRPRSFIIFFIFFGVSASYGQQDSARIPLGSLVKPVLYSGSVMTTPSYSINDSGIAWNDYTFSGDVLRKIPGVYLANMYQPGDPSEIFFDGIGGNYTRYTLDGVALNEPTTSTMNLYHIPMEFMNDVEYIDALRAPIYDFNSTGALVNFKSQSYSEQQPYSKIRHLEEPYNYLITDGVFSQNIGFNSNLDAGFERQTTDGRFLNSVYDGINIRAKYRYSIDSTKQFTLTELYYRTKGGMTGGAMPYTIDASTFDQFQINLRSQQADLTYLQHHLRAAYSQSDPVDSSNFISATSYYDYYNFIFSDGGIPYSLTNHSRKYGLDLRGSQVNPLGRLNYGGEIERDEDTYNTSTSIPSVTRFSIYGDQEFRLFNFVTAGIFGRGDIVESKSYPAYGASFGVGSDEFKLELGGSSSRHLPSQSEKYFVTQNFTGNPGLTAETDRDFQLTVSGNAGDNVSYYIKPYFRSIDKPIYYREVYNGKPAYPQISIVNLSSRDIYGLDLNAQVCYWKLVAEGKLNYTYEKVDGNQVYTLPKYSAEGELYLHEIMFDNHLNLKIGIRGSIVSTFSGSEFYPQALIYYPSNIDEFGPFGSSDVFLQAKIGDAILYLTFFNIAGQDYVLTPVYPALDRSFGFGVNWNFLN